MFEKMEKIYDPEPRVAYIVFSNIKNKKILYSACGNINAIKDFCRKHNIDYSRCNEINLDGCHYLEISYNG